jgi:hypothetical protein
MATTVETLRQSLTTAFMALPLMLIAYSFFMGFGLGNVGLIILFLGQLTVVPLSAAVLQFVFTTLKMKLTYA